MSKSCIYRQILILERQKQKKLACLDVEICKLIKDSMIIGPTAFQTPWCYVKKNFSAWHTRYKNTLKTTLVHKKKQER